jgi:hypothetical protein
MDGNEEEIRLDLISCITAALLDKGMGAPGSQLDNSPLRPGRTQKALLHSEENDDQGEQRE